ncbi:MAG: ZIP family metal transporter [Flavobacteriales bacterium]|nr:ZIP family metal transporter [Flavobacteriales bacterium]
MTSIYAALILFATTVVGAALAEKLSAQLDRRLPDLLAFGGAFLLGLCFLHILPEAYALTNNAGYYVLGGFLLQMVLEWASQGVEHGHVHGNRFSALAFFSLCLHALIESIPLGIDRVGMMAWLSENATAGFSHAGHSHRPLLFGLVLHKLPVAVALMALLRASGAGAGRRWSWVLVFGAMPAVGILVAKIYPFHAAWSGAMGGLLVGILLHIATTVLFEASDGHHFNWRKASVVILGLGLAGVTLL